MTDGNYLLMDSSNKLEREKKMTFSYGTSLYPPLLGLKKRRA
jgi:hypothetical protein